MAKQNVKNEGDERLESIETTLSNAELFIEKNQKAIVILLSVVIVAVLAFFGVKKLYLEPREENAQKAIYHAEQYFEKDNFEQQIATLNIDLGVFVCYNVENNKNRECLFCEKDKCIWIFIPLNILRVLVKSFLKNSFRKC